MPFWSSVTCKTSTPQFQRDSFQYLRCTFVVFLESKYYIVRIADLHKSYIAHGRQILFFHLVTFLVNFHTCFSSISSQYHKINGFFRNFICWLSRSSSTSHSYSVGDTVRYDNMFTNIYVVGYSFLTSIKDLTYICIQLCLHYFDRTR